MAARADQTLDCGAFLIDAGNTTSNEILGIGPPAAPIAPVVGMRVLKRAGTTSGPSVATASDIHAVLASLGLVALP